MKFIGFVGSLRKDSYNRKLMMAVAGIVPPEISFEFIEIGDVPMFNADMEANFPPAALAVKEKIRAADAVIIATPEFNRTVPAALKNITEWASRPYGDNAFAGKKVMVMGTSTGNISTALAQYDLKKILLYLNAKLLGQPEIMIATAQTKFDVAGALTDEGTKTFLAKSLSEFISFVHNG